MKKCWIYILALSVIELSFYTICLPAIPSSEDIEKNYKAACKKAKLAILAAGRTRDQAQTQPNANLQVIEGNYKAACKKAKLAILAAGRNRDQLIQKSQPQPKPIPEEKKAEVKQTAAPVAESKEAIETKLLALIDDSVRAPDVITEKSADIVKKIKAEKSVDTTCIPDTLVLVENTAVADKKRKAAEALGEAYGYIEQLQPNAKRERLETTGNAIMKTREEANQALKDLEKSAA